MKKVTVKFFPEITGKIAGVESFKLEEDGSFELQVLVESEETKTKAEADKKVEEVETESTEVTDPWETVEIDNAFKISTKSTIGSSNNLPYMVKVDHPVLKKNASFASVKGEELIVPNPQRLKAKKLNSFLVNELIKVFDGELEEGKTITGFEPAQFEEKEDGIQILKKGKIW